MNYKNVSNHIINWLIEQLNKSHQKGFVVGVSGGIDSAVVSTLCAKTMYPVIVLSMPIYQVRSQYSRAIEHIRQLTKKYKNVKDYTINLTNTFQNMIENLPVEAKSEIALANTRSRLRMTTLYSFANSSNYLVCGTGNKIEDFGIGFFTKYGDGGVDISPIADLYKSEVYEIAKFIGINKEIIDAPPTDGLWENDKTDEEQIGASYDELEWAMKYCMGNEDKIQINKDCSLTERQRQVLQLYLIRNRSCRHKIILPPICNIDKINK